MPLPTQGFQPPTTSAQCEGCARFCSRSAPGGPWQEGESQRPAVGRWGPWALASSHFTINSCFLQAFKTLTLFKWQPRAANRESVLYDNITVVLGLQWALPGCMSGGRRGYSCPTWPGQLYRDCAQTDQGSDRSSILFRNGLSSALTITALFSLLVLCLKCLKKTGDWWRSEYEGSKSHVQRYCESLHIL